MPSAWSYFRKAKPVTSDTRQQGFDFIKNNGVALWAMLGGAGLAPGWNMAAAGGTASQPATLTFTYDTTIKVRITLTWGTTGGEDGNVTKAVYEWSDDSGASYDALDDEDGNYVQTITYDGDANVTATTWGATP